MVWEETTVNAGAFMYPYKLSFAAFVESAQFYHKHLEVNLIFVTESHLIECEELYENHLFRF